jgi:hypothetical protein
VLITRDSQILPLQIRPVRKTGLILFEPPRWRWNGGNQRQGAKERLKAEG